MPTLSFTFLKVECVVAGLVWIRRCSYVRRGLQIGLKKKSREVELAREREAKVPLHLLFTSQVGPKLRGVQAPTPPNPVIVKCSDAILTLLCNFRMSSLHD